MNPIIITIDGAAGTGTSSLAKGLSQHLKWPYMNTGHLYRSIAKLVREQGIHTADEEAISKIAAEIQFDFTGGSVVAINGHAVTESELAAMSDIVARISHYPMVREHIRGWQKNFASAQHCIMEGRDLGSVVFPEAHFKLYLECDDAVRARRRSNQLGRVVTVEELLERDQLDAEREDCPMIRPPGSHVLNTTETSVPELVSAVEVFMRGIPEIREVIC